MSYCQKVCYTRYAVSNRVVFTLNSLTVSYTRSAGSTDGREVWYADELWETEWGASPKARRSASRDDGAKERRRSASKDDGAKVPFGVE